MHSHQPVASLATNPRDPKTRVARSNGRPLRAMPLMRKYEVAHLNSFGDVEEFSQIAPSLPIFEDAFAAIARGSLFSTEAGLTAVEDLLPGMRLQTTENGFQTLLWIGSTTLVPDSLAGARGQSPEMGFLTRIAADSFGLGRPMPDLILGPKARLTVRHRTKGQVLAPVATMQNGETVFSVTPFTPVRVYHLAFETHQILRVNGLEIESYHPGNSAEMSLSREMLPLFMGLFPHCETVDDFGTLCLPRIEEDDALEQIFAGFAA
ncbi:MULTISPECIES: Hint domain-containing protein [Falsihalocynthiibacter]|uniref:Hint domain-containing protein n=1 Tax=Falsihalocynthiibacter TaxID=2854182 RepID=UPI003003797E